MTPSGVHLRPSASICGSLFDALRKAAAVHPERGFGIYDSRGRSVDRKTYPEFLELIRESAARLAAAGVQAGDRVMVCQPTSWNWMRAWFGALWLGARPVALAPFGNAAAIATYLSKTEDLVERLGVTRLVAEEGLRKEALVHGAARTAAAVVTVPELDALSFAGAVPEPQAEPEEIAFLQLTSGSTGRQRAVTIPHRAALHNVAAMDHSTREVRPEPEIRCVVSWLPLYHDMGLIGSAVYCIAHGYDLWLMRPEVFLGRPRVWLNALATHPGALTAAPNFSFQACVERCAAEEVEGSLSGWVGAMTGAEMIRPETCTAFAERFASKGFRAEVFRPCYGMAEMTLCATMDRKGGVRTLPVPEGAGSGSGLKQTVCTGPAVMDTEIRIAAPGGTVLPEGAVGEVLVKGPSVFAGYFQDREATAEALRDGWLRTGDLGFLSGGELYLTGRTKEVLIIHGHNLMPHELEWLAESETGGGGTARCGAFSVARGAEGEQAVLVVEMDGRGTEGLPDLAHRIRSRIGRALGLPLADLVFVRRGQLPKTTSGKIQRGELRARYLEGRIERL